MSRAVSVGELQHVSASQITNFNLCNRRWWFEKVAQIPVPGTAATDLGGDIHRQMEKLYESGITPEHKSAALLANSGLIPAPGPSALIEHPRDYGLNLFIEGVAVRGRADLIDVSDPSVVDIWDWKSKGDFRYTKRPDELERDLQLNIYGLYAYKWLAAGSVRFFHGYIKTGEGFGYKVVKTDHVELSSVESFVQNVAGPIVAEMKTCASAGEFSEVPPNWNSCYAFRKPCPFLETCTKGQSASVHLRMLFEGEEQQMGLGEKLKGETSSTPAPVPGVTTATLFKGGPYEATSTRPGLTLYINALPVKGVENITHLDDIIGDASKEICAAKKVLDLRLLAYGEGKALLAAGLRKNPPTGTVVATTGELSDVAIEALLPLADVVIRGTR